jgi:hypothetical protein
MLRDSEPVVIFDPQMRAEVVFLLVSSATPAGNSYSYGGNNFVFRFSGVMASCVEMIAIAGFGGWQVGGGCRQLASCHGRSFFISDLSVRFINQRLSS